MGAGGLRLDELRHRLIPLYNYDPAEAREWEDDGNENEDEELSVSEPMNFFTSFQYTQTARTLMYLFIFHSNRCTRRESSQCRLPTERERQPKGRANVPFFVLGMQHK